MSIVSWNCRGLGSAAAVRSVKDVIHSHQPRVLCLLETKKSAKSWDYLRVSLGFTNCFSVDRVGLSGGLAVLWKDDVQLIIRNFSRYHIHMEVDIEGIFDLTLFYGNPVERKRVESWLLLRQIRAIVNKPWMVVGDFNEVFFGWEVSGKRLRDSASMRRFRDVVDSCGLVDLGFHGSIYTFSNKRIYPHEYKARLDRVLVTADWKDLFHSASVKHATALRSDHCPIVTSLLEPLRSGQRKLFHYEAMWHRHNQFREAVVNAWDKAHQSATSFSNALKVCAHELNSWNKNSFGHVQRSIKGLKNRLEVIRSQRRSSDMVEKEKDVMLQLDEWLEREEWMWRQRSRIEWLKEGDRNSKFFHSKASQRKATNRIRSLKTDQGTQVFSQPELMRVVSNYFQKLFDSELAEDEVDWNEELQIIDSRITEEMNASLVARVSNEEIRTTLFQMSPSKAPGLDGFPALFFQKNWSVVGEAVCAEVSKFLNDGILSDEANLTRIALIPKCKDADRMESFRPISLCPVIMRLASKVIAGRLQTILPQVISEGQSAFIKGRLISDNILIAHELAHFIKSRKGKCNGLASLKLDMSKAFDRLEWKFIERMLLKLGFCQQWVKKVLLCIRSVSYKVQVNGELTDNILPSRGIRQGDPISPYIFILCTEWLAAALKKELKGIKLANEAPEITHLFFADDSLVFTKANTERFQLIKNILLRYQRLSGQKINLQKSEIVFSPNVNPDLRTEICQIMEMSEVDKHSQYLGLPLMIGQNKQAMFRFIEEKSTQRISNWKSKLLSSAGKETLLKAVIQAIPQYSMSCYKLPLSTCNRLVQLMTRFWWSNHNSANPIHWVRRKLLFGSKDEGGLGLRCPVVMNEALLLKQAWRIMSDPHILLSKLFKSKYFRDSSLLDSGLGSQPSHAWRSLFNVKHHLLKGIELVDEEDRPLWKLSGCGDFTTQSAYYLIRASGPDSALIMGESSSAHTMRTFWNRVWKLKLPGKIKIFIWRVFHNGLPDSINLRKRGLSEGMECLFCGWNPEDSCHLFRDCWWAKAIGERLLLPVCIFQMTGGSPADWLVFCANRLSKVEFRNLVCGTWCIWTSRNAIAHDKAGWSIEYITAKVQSLTLQWDKYADGINLYSNANTVVNSNFIFCDGSWISYGAEAGMAALFIKEEVIYELSASFKKGIRSSREAEGEALLLGLHLGLFLKLPTITFYSDSLEVVAAIFNGLIRGRHQPEWLTLSAQILSSNKGWRVEHCPRENNSYADAVAKFSRLNSWSWNVRGALPRIDPLGS